MRFQVGSIVNDAATSKPDAHGSRSLSTRWRRPPAVAAAAIVGLALPSSAIAQDCQDYWTEAYKRNQGCISDAPDSSGGNDYGAPTPDPAAVTRSQAHEFNEQGVAAIKAGDDARAAELFSQALRLSPTDSIIAANLRDAEARVAQKQRDAEARVRADQEYAAQQQHLGHVSDVLRAIGGTPAGNGLDFDSGQGAKPSANAAELTFSPSSAQPSAPLIVTDSMVVDARVIPWGSDLPKVAEIEASPGAIPARRGLEAISKHDWPLALAMYQTALQMDPDNAALKRAVDMAQWILDWRTQHAEPQRVLQASLSAIEKHNEAGTRSALAQVKELHPEWSPQDSDLELLFGVMDSKTAADAEDKRYWKFIDGPGGAATGSTSERQSALVLSVSRELHDEALLQFMMGDQAGFNKKLEQSKAVWHASEPTRNN